MAVFEKDAVMVWLKLSIIFALILVTVIFIIYFFRIYHYYRPKPQPKPRGDVKKGKVYSLSLGLLPWEKESTRKHWPVYIIGIIYHSAIAFAFFRLVAILFNLNFFLNFFSNRPVMIFLFVGTVSGLSLFFRRLLKAELRQLSYPDDYAANLLVNLFLLNGAISIFFQKALIFFLLNAFFLILYLPLGKIRHCVFFIPSRLIFGQYYGLRGVLPPPFKKIFQ